MSLMDMNSASLSRQIGQPVPEIYVVIAKHEVSGLDAKQIQEVLGLSLEEWTEVQEDAVYKTILLLLRAEAARTRIDTDITYDAIENVALERLYKRVAVETDGDFLLKVVAVTNRAQRRNGREAPVLDPQQAGGRIPLTLTRRVVHRIHSDGSQEKEETQSIMGGAVGNPSFAEVDSVLNVTAKPHLPKRIEVKTVTPDPTFAEFDAEMRRRGF